MYYEIKLTTNKPDMKRSGMMKKVTEQYLVECELFAEAECRGNELYNGNCDVFSIQRSKVKELVNGLDEEKHTYRATIIATYPNEKGGETEMKYVVLVSAKDLTEANSLMQDYIKQGLDDMTLDSIVGTKIISLL